MYHFLLILTLNVGAMSGTLVVAFRNVSFLAFISPFLTILAFDLTTTLPFLFRAVERFLFGVGIS